MATSQTSAALRATRGHKKKPKKKPKKKGWRDRHFKWVDNGDGTVTRTAYWVRHAQKPPDPHPRGPGPRPVPKPQRPRPPAKPSKLKVYSGPFGRLQAGRMVAHLTRLLGPAHLTNHPTTFYTAVPAVPSRPPGC